MISRGLGLSALGEVSRLDPREGITVRPRGGLGNHLFCFGSGLAKARHLKVPFFVEIQKSNLPGSPGNALRSLFAGLEDVRFVRLGGVRSAIFQARKSSLKVWTQGLSHDAPDSWETIEPGTHLDGYLQVHAFVRPALEEMSQFLFNKGFFASTPKGSRVFGEGDIAVNIRRGDYEHQDVKKIHGVLSDSYFESAEKLMRDHGFQGTAWFTSDSRQLKIPPSHYSSRQWLDDEKLSSWELMQVLAQAPGLIISNSTFGWWSAAFGTVLFNQSVCGPSAWKLNQPDAASRLFFDQWRVVKTSLET